MAQLTDVERKWIVDLTGEGAGKPGAIEEEQHEAEETAKLKQKYLDQMADALDRVRDEIAEGERYELIIKGRFRDKKVKSVQKASKTFEEVETMEDIKKAEALSEKQQKKIFEAHKKAIEVKDIMAKATVKVKGKDGKETEKPLFTDEEITEEFWTPVMRERLLPDNAIPARHSVVQQTFKASAELYHDRLDELEAESGERKDIAKILGITTQGIAAAGELTDSICKLTGAPALASVITKGVQVGLMAGTGIAKGVLEKSADGVVDNIAKLINVTVGGATSPAMGLMVSNAFKATAKAAVIAKHLSRGKAGIPDALASLGDAIDSSMTAADTDSTNGAWAMTGKLIAGALKAQKGITPVIMKAIGDGKKPDVHALIRGFTKAAASAFGTYMEVKRDFLNAEIKAEAEETKKKAEEAKHEAELGKREVLVAKAEDEKKQEEARHATAESQTAAKEAEAARKEAEEARKEAENLSKAAEAAMLKADNAKGEQAEKLREKAVEATEKASEAANRASELTTKAAELADGARESAEKMKEALEAAKEAREEAERAEKEASAKEKEAEEAEEEAKKKEEEADKECEENSEKVIVAEERLEWATEGEEEEGAKGKKRKSAKEKKAEFEAELKARGLDMEKLKAASTTKEALEAVKKKTEELEAQGDSEKLREKSEEFKALLEDSMKADGEAADTAQELRSVERLIKQMEADKAILETFNMIIDTAGVIADQLVPGLRAVTAGKDFILAVIAAAERACQFNMWCDRLDDAQNSLSPYAEPIKNRVKNSKLQMTQKTILAILKAAQVAGAVSACTGIGAAGLAVEKAATLTEKGMDIALKIKTMREMAAQWKLFQEAYDNPDNRRKGKEALKGNPTLSKYALAYGAITANDANAREAARKCGLTDATLAHEDTNVGIVVKYLELKFEDDPQLYKPIPKTPEWAPKGSEIELTLESWMSMKEAAIKKGDLKKDQPTGAIDGGFARLAKASKNFEAKKKKGTLTDAELALCKEALADLQAALQKFAPVKKNGEPHTSMKDYAKDLFELAKQQGNQFEIDFLIIEAQQAEKTGQTQTPDTATAQQPAAQQPAAKPPSVPKGFNFFRQGGDNLCAYYALNHFNNRDVGKDTFIATAKEFYKRIPDVDDVLAQKMVDDGNDPAILVDFGLSEKAFGAGDVYVVAGDVKAHFWVIRKSEDSWWTYDGLKTGPVLIGDDHAVSTHIGGKKLYA